MGGRIVIKRGLAREDLQVDAHVLRRALLDNGYAELPIASAHAMVVEALPPIHQDPFGRILVAQAQAEGLILLTTLDHVVAKYPGPIRLAGQ